MTPSASGPGWRPASASACTAIAEIGAGAYLNGARLRTPEPPPESEMTGQLNTGFFEEEERNRLRAEARVRFGRIGSLSCAGHDFLAQSLGERHFSFYRRLWPWDHVAGVLLLRESGGKVDRIDGVPYRAGDRVHGLLATSRAETWSALRGFLGNRGLR